MQGVFMTMGGKLQFCQETCTQWLYDWVIIEDIQQALCECCMHKKYITC